MTIAVAVITRRLVIDGEEVPSADLDFTMDLEERTVTGTLRTTRGRLTRRILLAIGDPLGANAQSRVDHRMAVDLVAAGVPGMVRADWRADVRFRLEKFRHNDRGFEGTEDEFIFSFFGAVSYRNIEK